jgi:hypothetical protein
VGHKDETNPVVSDVNVRMVSSRFGKKTYAIHERERVPKIVALESPNQLARLNLPPWKGSQARGDI